MSLETSIGHQPHSHQTLRPKPEPTANGLPLQYQAATIVGAGAYTEIWKVRHRASGQLLALKRLRPDWRDNRASMVLLENEFSVANQVTSRYVVRLVDADLDCDQPYLLMEWIAGCTLERKLMADGQFSVAHLLWIARQCVLGMYDLEQAGYAHGDVRPANVMIAENGECKLIDLARATSLTEKDGLPRSDFLIGPAEYMSPEQFIDGDWQPISSDLYSLGVSLYQLFSGRLPFEATNVIGLMRQKRELEVPPLSQSCPDAPREMIHLLDSLLSKPPIRRPHSLKNLAREFISLELATQRRFSFAG